RRVIANRLRELDRFLSVLLDEIAVRLEGPAHDGERFARTSNTSKKLQIVESMTGAPSGDDVRLRVFGGIVASMRRGRDMSAARRSGDPLAVTGDVDLDQVLALGWISEFYRNLGDRLMKEISHPGTIP